ncbi:recombinase family protein [Microbacterium sp.]|uniref:recombinase family protein n=1 Tax=Microbacterium sp. TaxID=51671 RepID=UPI0037C5EFDE
MVGYTRELLPGEGTTTDADELRRAGATEVFAEEDGPDAGTRPVLHACLESLEPGDRLLVTSAVRLSVTVPHFLSTMAQLGTRGVWFRSLAEPALCTGDGTVADTAELYAELEALKRRLVSLQTRAGMATAATKGRRPGRPTVMTPDRVAMAIELRNLGRPTSHIARVLGVSPNAVQRALAATPPADSM